MLLNNEWVNNDIKKKNQKIPWDKQKWKHNNPKSIRHSESSPKREIHSITGLPQQKIEISKNYLALLKELEKNKRSPKWVEGRK